MGTSHACFVGRYKACIWSQFGCCGYIKRNKNGKRSISIYARNHPLKHDFHDAINMQSQNRKRAEVNTICVYIAHIAEI